jgi:mannitol-specific phosphotransferase system IIBC component
MAYPIEIDTSTKVATASGTVITFFRTIHTEDILKTVVLSIIGAVVSFIVSLIMKWLLKKLID